MASITIRNLDDEVQTRLRIRAEAYGRSMEEEAHQILREALGCAKKTQDLASIFRAYFGPENGIDLELPERHSGREPPSSEEVRKR